MPLFRELWGGTVCKGDAKSGGARLLPLSEASCRGWGESTVHTCAHQWLTLVRQLLAVSGRAGEGGRWMLWSPSIQPRHERCFSRRPQPGSNDGSGDCRKGSSPCTRVRRPIISCSWQPSSPRAAAPGRTHQPPRTKRILQGPAPPARRPATPRPRHPAEAAT